MEDNKRLELIRLSAIDFEAFKKQFEILSPAERMEFKNYIERVQDYIKDNENKKMEDVTGFPAPQSSKNHQSKATEAFENLSNAAILL